MEVTTIRSIRNLISQSSSFSFFPTVVMGATLLTVSGCAPLQERERPQEECFDSNVRLVAFGDEQYTRPIPQAPAIDDIMKPYLAASSAPAGCAVGVVVDNQLHFLKGYGHADRATGTDYTHATMQGVASISKTITALAIMKLVEQGHISLDDQVNQHLGSVNFNLLGVTIRDLLAHTSGLPKSPEWNSDLDTEEELIEVYPGYAHPGINPRFVQKSYEGTETAPLREEKGHYSNTGYSLLGAVIDTVTNKPDFSGRRGYEAYTWWNVALKEGVVSGPTLVSMCLDTYWRQDDILNLATGYRSDGVTVFPNSVNPDGGPGGWRGPAGGWAMTIGDLSRLMIGINTNRFITPGLKAEMMDAGIRPPTGEHTFGLGVWKIVNLDRPTFMHGGNIDGFTARYTFWPNEGVGVALMCNREKAGNFRQLTNDIAALFLEGQSNADQVLQPSTHSPDELRAARLVELILVQANDAEHRPGDLAATANGQRIVRAMNAGDLGSAMAVARSMLRDLRLGDIEPSPLSGGLDETP